METSVDSVKKTYYSISEVCGRTGLEPHVLRYWESEFPQLRPKKNRAGNRAYRDKDIEIIEYIKFLLYDQQFTIPGAKKKLGEMKDPEAASQVPAPPLMDAAPPVEATTSASIDKAEMVRQLKDILGLLGRDAG